MTKEYKNCQSCGMSISKDSEKGGFEPDGSKSTKFCSHCYADGKFVNPEMTVDEMQILVKRELKELGFPGFITRFYIKGLTKLERWKKS